MYNNIESLIEKVASYIPNIDISKIKEAYEYAKNAHKDQKRDSGEPYIIHPLEVAHILADMQLDHNAIIAGILHDVIEDTQSSYQDVSEHFGEEVALLVEGVTKLDKIEFTTKEDQQIESLRKMFLAMAKDVRVILIKLADRLHNMRTLRNVKPEKQLLKARETLEVYAPIAHRLGISSIKSELEDLSLRHLDSVAYYEIAESIKQKKVERDRYIEDIKKTIKEKLCELNIEATIAGRAKNIYSIFRKMYAQNKSIEEIYDLFAVRVIVNTINECYAVLGMVHELYIPIPGRFKDYIAMPKPNMYQSLHSTVIGPEGLPCEIQIRTYDMHNTAENGIAAHWKYKDGVTGKVDDADIKLVWIRQFLDIQKDLDDAEDFMQSLKIDLFADEVFVFTPKGDVINLPAGSTPIDFAFAIHSAVGSRMMGAKVNSKIVPLDYQLTTGDIVEVLTSSSIHGPNLDWLSIAKTSQAKSKINQWFKKERREENVIIGKELIDKEVKKLGLSMASLFKKEYLELCLKRFGFATVEDMYASVGYGSISANRFITRLKRFNKEYLIKEAEELAASQPPAEITRKAAPGSNIAVKGIDNCLVRVSRCCTPLPGDEIIGYITKGRGVSVHRKDCVNIRTDLLSEEEKSRIIECFWVEQTQGKFICDLIIESTDRQGLLVDITISVGDLKISIRSMNSRISKNKIAIIELTIEVSEAEQLNNLIKRLYTIPGVYNVVRSHTGGSDNAGL